MNGSMRWWVLAFLAGVILLGSAGGFLWSTTQPARPIAPPRQSPPAAKGCPDLDAPIPALLPATESTALLLKRGLDIQVLLDGKPAAPALEVPAGEHTLRAEADGASALQLTFRTDAFRPALFHVENTPGLGLTVVYLGAACQSCPPALDAESLDFARDTQPGGVLLAQAAQALRSSDWRTAAAHLRGVAPAGRQTAAFRRLASFVYQSTAQSALARAQLEKDLPGPLDELDARSRGEEMREQSLGLTKWNLLTEKFSRLLERFALDAPGPVQLATSRLAELSEGFVKAAQEKDPLAQDETVRAGEEALAQFIRSLRRSRPEDCDFQARISAASL